MKRELLLFLTIVLCFFALAGCGQENSSIIEEEKPIKNAEAASQNPGKTITFKQYEGIKAGMSYEEVVRLLGLEGEQIQANGEGRMAYKWASSEDPFMFAYLNFDANRLDRKFGMISTSSSKVKVTKEMYNKLKTGMTYKEVTALLGLEGTLSYEMDGKEGEFKQLTYTYQTKGQGDIMTTYRDGKLISKSYGKQGT